MNEIIKQMVEALEWCHGGEMQECPNYEDCKGACFQCEYFNAETGTVEYPPLSVQPVEMEALADNDSAYAYADGWNDCVRKFKATHPGNAAIQAGKQAIADLESQQPVALPCCGYTDASAVKWNPLNGVVQCHNCGQTYTTPQRTWVGLTDEEFDELRDNNFGVSHLISAVEAQLKERNT